MPPAIESLDPRFALPREFVRVDVALSQSSGAFTPAAVGKPRMQALQILHVDSIRLIGLAAHHPNGNVHRPVVLERPRELAPLQPLTSAALLGLDVERGGEGAIFLAVAVLLGHAHAHERQAP